MPVFKSTLLKPGAPRKSSGGGYFSSTMASSQLSIMEDMLKTDGVLNQADYDILTKKAIELRQYFSSGSKSDANALAALDQRISSYMLGKSQFDLNKQFSTDKIENELNDTLKTISLSSGTKPAEYLDKASKTLNETINFIGDQYDKATKADNWEVASKLSTTYNKIKEQYDDVISMKAALESGKADNFAAFIDTDAAGRITGINYKPLNKGEVGGYMPTNALLDDVKVYVRPVVGPDGVSKAYLAGNKFDNTVGIASPISGNPVHDVLISGDPAQQIKLDSKGLAVRGYIPDGSWAHGRSGNFYKNIGDNSYIKYPNFDPDVVGLKSTDYQDVNSIWEDQINRSVVASGGAETLGNEFKYNSPAPPMSIAPTNQPQITNIQRDVAVAQKQSSAMVPENPVTPPRPGLWDRAKQYFSGLAKYW